MKEDNGVSKILCYLGIFVLLLFIILPPLFRVLFPREEEHKEEKIPVVMNLTCVKIEDFDDYRLTTTINSNYHDNKIFDSIFVYEVDILDSPITENNISILEYDNLKVIDNVDFEENDNKYTLKINYNKFNYSNEELLLKHQMILNEQFRYYTDNLFECNTKQVQ